MINTILRWFGGYSELSVGGAFPERFLNLAAKNGLHLWKMKGSRHLISFSAKYSDLPLAERLAQKSGCELSVIRHCGLPVLSRKYKSRLGLLIGLIIGSLVCAVMSGYIWTVEIACPDCINEYEIRQELRELGFYEGCRYDYDRISGIEDEMMIRDGRISWLSINVAGCSAVVDISPKTKIDSDRSKKTKTLVSNMLSDCDGTVTRISVRSGQAAVRVGDGIRKGSLLVSGIAELPDGSNVLYDSDGEVYAKTEQTLSLFLPKSTASSEVCGQEAVRRSISFFGLTIPLSLTTEPKDGHFTVSDPREFYLCGHIIPIGLDEEHFIPYKRKDILLSKEDAKKLLDVRADLYTSFLNGQDKTTVLSQKRSFSENEDGYTIKVRYELERNAAEKVYIEVRD